MPCVALRCVTIAFSLCALALPLLASQKCPELHFSQHSRDRNTLTGTCHDIVNEVNILRPRILLNGTTPPTGCFNMTYLDDNTTVIIVFNANCEGNKNNAFLLHILETLRSSYIVLH